MKNNVNTSNNCQFNPLNHGFEPITKFPELKFNFPMIDGYFVKIICYSNYGDLVYWYLIISTHVGLDPDDRVQIMEGSYDFRKLCEYDTQTSPKTTYLGLISNDEFAKSLLTHLMGTTRNDSLNNHAITRYNQNLGCKMREEFSIHYPEN